MVMENKELSEIVASILKGEKDHYRFIVREFSLIIRCYLSSRLYHQDDVEDLTQEVFIIAFKKLETYKPDDNFKNWLIGIAKYQLFNHLRKNKRRNNAMEDFREHILKTIEPDLNTEAENLKEDQVENLLNCISKLSDRARTIVRSSLDGSKLEELSEQLNLSQNAIYQARFRAHKQLKKCMEIIN